MIKLEDIKTFKMSDLNGKTIRIFATKSEDGLVIVMGYDKDTGHCYVLSIEDVK